MRIEDMTIVDRFVPVEQVIKLIREEKITDAKLEFFCDSGAQDHRGVIYRLSGNVGIEVGIKGLDLFPVEPVE